MTQTFEEWLETVDRVTVIEVELRDKGAAEMAQKVLNWKVRELLAYTFLGNIGEASFVFQATEFTVKLTASFERASGSQGSEHREST